MKTLIKILCLSVLWFSCEEQNQDVYGCTNETACNFNPDANIYVPDSCVYLGDKMEQGYCSCNDEVYDCANECGGIRIDTDNDGICDDVDDCVGEYDCSGDCNGADTGDCGGNCHNQNVELWNECYNIEITEINLNNQSLIGEIPPEIENLWNLEWLDLGNNQLIGEIPMKIDTVIINENNGGVITLDTIWNVIFDNGRYPSILLNNNQLTGEIPGEICNIEVDLSNNKFCPPYPECISQDDIDSQDTSNCP